LLAAHEGNATALATARALLRDGEAKVRAAAAWSLGSIGEAADIPALDALAGAQDPDGATNALAAIGRLAARTRSGGLAARALCARLSDARPYARANALAGLTIAGARCEGSIERGILSSDPSEDARAAAAALLSRSPTPDDLRALRRCSRTDPSGAVAARCLVRAELPSRAHPALIYVVAQGAAPRPETAFALLLADGTLHAGAADRRGAVFDPVAPEGEATLRPPSALAR
jgi:HEAT repeat protein